MQTRAIIWRHRRENLKKCTLRGLESRPDIKFYTYPRQRPELPEGTIVLALAAPELTLADAGRPLLLIDGTWRYARVMQAQLPPGLECRSLPSTITTAYPRRQEDCEDPHRGLASIEALFAAYKILGYPTEGLLDHYHWRNQFLSVSLTGDSGMLRPYG